MLKTWQVFHEATLKAQIETIRTSIEVLIQ